MIGVIEEFLRHLTEERHLAPLTAKSYRADLVGLSAFLKSRNGVGGVERTLLTADVEDLNAFVQSALANGLAHSSVARKCGTFATFYRFCTRFGLIEANPFLAVHRVHANRKAPRVLSEEEVRRLLSAPDTSTFLGARDRAMMAVLYSTGIKVGELVALRMKDLENIHDGVIFVGRKGHVVSVTVGSETLATLVNYCRLLSQKYPRQNNDPFFVNKSGEALSSRSLRRKLEVYLAKAGLPAGITPQTLRHSYAAHQLTRGVDIQTVQRELGHRSLSSTVGMYGGFSPASNGRKSPSSSQQQAVGGVA